MSLKFDREKGKRVVKCVLHRVADIPGGVTVSVADLGGDALFEGTPIGVGVGLNGLFRVVKTAQIITAAANDATAYEVAKGHHFKTGDYFAAGTANGQAITAIDKTDPAKDVITVGTTLGIAVAANTAAYQTTGSTKTLAVTPCAFAGSNWDVRPNDNRLTSAWVIGVLRESNAPKVTDAIKTALKGVIYI
jgi:hypothetical protein